MATKKVPYRNKLLKLPKNLEYSVVALRGIGWIWDPPLRWYFHSPKTLLELALDVIDSQPLPECITWNTNRVVEWIETTVGLPQYSACFEDNFIRGKHLLLISPSHLAKMNIQKFDHILIIMQEIRKLYGVLRPKFTHDLTKPSMNNTEYDWLTLYYRYTGRCTPGEAAPPSVFWQKIGLIGKLGIDRCQWYDIKSAVDTENKVIMANVKPSRRKEPLYRPTFQEDSYMPTEFKSFSNEPCT